MNVSCLAFDIRDNLYISDPGNHTIRKMTLDGQTTTFLGDRNDTETFGSLYYPSAICIDKEDFLYICDRLHSVVWKCDMKCKEKKIIAGVYNKQRDKNERMYGNAVEIPLR